MVNCQYRYFVPPHRVDNPVITDDQFSNIVPAVFRYRSPGVWEGCETVYRGVDTLDEDSRRS